MQMEEVADAEEQHEVQSHEEPPTPMVGEKRPREEDDTSDPRETANALAAPTVIQTVSNSSPITSVNGVASMNGASYGANMGAHQGVVGAGQGGGYDALYIGDLQWVCVSCHLVLLCAYHSETLSCFSVHSGQPMRTFGRSRSMWMLPSTIKI